MGDLNDTVKQRISNAGTLNRPINIEEVVTAIEKLNRRAAPGVDGIPTQCVKEAWKGDDKEDPMGHILAPHLKPKLFNIIFDSGLGLSRCLGPGECLHSFIHF